MSFAVPTGFRLAGVYCGIKEDRSKRDLTLVVSDRPCAAAGVYTTNLVFAAPVGLDRQRTPSESIRVVVVNSGNANACTGAQGDRDAAQMAAWAAGAAGAKPEQSLVMSTGVIGHYLPMDKIEAGIAAASAALGSDDAALLAAATGILTTDTRPKLAGRTVRVGSRVVQITGLCKGAAMIGPRMATMLGLVLTDAPLRAADAQRVLSAVVADSFNCISVDGHMSTNDTVLLLANGAAGGEPLSADELVPFQAALEDVCGELARAIPADGEGATHFVTLDVEGCATRDEAHRIAKTVAESPLVKTAIAGADPNWGRIVSAAGYSGVRFDPTLCSLWVNGHALYERGAPLPFDERLVSDSLHQERETHIRLVFGEGTARVRFWTTDLTAEYVRLNADYRT